MENINIQEKEERGFFERIFNRKKVDDLFIKEEEK